MLKIRPIERYSIPRYPKGVYSEAPDFISLESPRGVLTAAMLALFLDACSGGGQTGPPPLPPDMVTESEARTIVDQVFANNGIDLVNDVDLSIEIHPGDSDTVNVDGFNDSLQTGYEYLTPAEHEAIPMEVRVALDSLIDEPEGPFVKMFDPTYVTQSALLESLTQEFIDSLRANGSI